MMRGTATPFALVLFATAFVAPLFASDRFEQFRVIPSTLQLVGADAQRGLLVEGQTAAGNWVDLTHEATFRASTSAARVSPSGVVYGVADGSGEIQADIEGQTLLVAFQVAQSSFSRPLDFEADIVPILGKHGCNSSGCHGKAEGQNGFKLSVFGFNPAADHVALTQEGRGRRVFVASPAMSLLLTKASGAVPHGGGARIPTDSHSYNTILRWIEQGARLESGQASPLVKLTVTPRERVVSMGRTQQLRVTAFYANGREVDVTGIARFDTNNPALAVVDVDGRVTAGETPGQAAVMASFMGQVDRFQVLIPRDGAEIDAGHPEPHFIDRAIQNRLTKLRIKPASLTDDATFLRRASLDIIGVLPTAQETRSFLVDKDPNKRRLLVDRLLERPEYADYWSLKWADLLRVDRRALGHKKAYAYYRWIHTRFAENAPFDRFASEVITASGPLRDSPQGHFYAAVSGAGAQASTLSQVFLGVRIACAECHHHPFDRWSQSDYLGMSSYFASLKRGASVRGDALFAANSAAQMKHPRTQEKIAAHTLGQRLPPNHVVPKGDQRAELARWMTAGDNPWFARAVANRYWAHFFGRGVVEPVDDFRDTNPPTNPELLESLAANLIRNQFDVKTLIREITSSKAYQRSTAVNETNERDEQNFSRRLIKRLEAEVLFDAVLQVTDAPEKFQGVPHGYRAVQLWDSETPHYFLKQFGRPQRKSACACERISAPNVGQVLHLLNSQELADKVSHAQGRAARLTRQYSDDQSLTHELYLVMLAREPTTNELKAAAKYLSDKSQTRRNNVEDLMWALMNSIEFIFNH